MKGILLMIEKVFIRIGALLGVVSTIILLNSELLKPSPPMLDVTFLISKTDEINYAQQLSDPKQEYSEPFPVGLTTHNKGGTVAKSVVLSILPERTAAFKFEGVQVETRTITREDGFIPIHRIHLGNINPGEKVFLDNNAWCQVFNVNRVRVKAHYKSGEDKEVPLDNFSITYDFELRLSSENAEPKTKHLYLTTGLEGQFLNKKKPYYIFHEGQITLKGWK